MDRDREVDSATPPPPPVTSICLGGKEIMNQPSTGKQRKTKDLITQKLDPLPTQEQQQQGRARVVGQQQHHDEECIPAPPPQKKKKPLSRDQRIKKKEPPTTSMRFVEYVAMGGAFMSTVSKITSMCVGETVDGIRTSLDPMKSMRTEFEEMIFHLEQEDDDARGQY
jgi:hypothetical protein